MLGALNYQGHNIVHWCQLEVEASPGGFYRLFSLRCVKDGVITNRKER
ncbi:MAG: hypothetical protein RMZ69_10795 [Nostoc sp. ChiQUE01a]|nr:hypothetical protein [Nostoc sp. ChiQUE01a]